MWLCELYKDQDIIIRINRNIYHGPIKRIYQTFYDKWIEIPLRSDWFPAKIIGKASEKLICNYDDKLLCSSDFIENYRIYYPNEPLHYKDLKFLPDYIKTGIVSDWLFGVEFKDGNNQFYELPNGIIVPAR